MSAPTVTATPARSKMDTRTITSIAMLTGVSVIIAWMSKLMPPVMFLDFDFKHVAVCVGGFTFGPMAAAIISVLACFIELITFSGTGPWGFLMNSLATCSFCCTASWVYQRARTKRGAVLGLGLGVVCLVAVTAVLLSACSVQKGSENLLSETTENKQTVNLFSPMEKSIPNVFLVVQDVMNHLTRP